MNTIGIVVSIERKNHSSASSTIPETPELAATPSNDVKIIPMMNPFEPLINYSL